MPAIIVSTTLIHHKGLINFSIRAKFSPYISPRPWSQSKEVIESARENMSIPKIIHQTVPNKGSLSPLFRENIDFLKTNNPDWDHRLYDDEDCRKFILENFGDDYLNTFNKIHPEYGAAKADFFRYLLIYRIGGVYLDIKSTAMRPLSEVISESDSYILSYWDNAKAGKYPGVGFWPQYGIENELQQWHIIAEAQHPYLREVINRVKNNIDRYDPFAFGIGGIGVLRATGPIAYSLAIEPIKTQYSHRHVQIEDLGIDYSFLRNQAIDARKLIGSDYTKSKQPLTGVSTLKRLCFGITHWAQNDLKILIRHPVPKCLKNVLKLTFKNIRE